jgi:hypothetical protein
MAEKALNPEDMGDMGKHGGIKGVIYRGRPAEQTPISTLPAP